MRTGLLLVCNRVVHVFSLGGDGSRRSNLTRPKWNATLCSTAMLQLRALSPSVPVPPREVEITLVTPMRDEAHCVGDFLSEVVDTLRGSNLSFEVICVDDGSSDDTAAAVAAMCREAAEVRLIRLDRSYGQSAAIAAGLGYARGCLIAFIDADLQNDPRDLLRMISVLQSEPDADAVVGWRQNRRDSRWRRISSRVANGIGRWIIGERTTDGGCGLKIFRAAILERLPAFDGMHRLMAPLVRLRGGRIVEVSVNHRSRVSGRSKYGSGLGRTFRVLRDALGVRWLRSRRLSFEATEVHGE